MKYDLSELMIMTDGLTLFSYKEGSKDKVMKWFEKNIEHKHSKFQVMQINPGEVLSQSPSIDALVKEADKVVEDIKLTIKYLSLSFHPVIIIDYEGSVDLMKAFIEMKNGTKVNDDKLKEAVCALNDNLINKLMDLQPYMVENGAGVILLNPISYILDNVYTTCIFSMNLRVDEEVENQIKFDMNTNPGYIEYVKHKNFKEGVCILEEIK